MKFRYKFFALALSLSTLSPSIAFASEVVKYDNSNLDQVFTDNGIDYDKAEVEKRKEKFKKNPNNYIAPDYEVKEVIETEEISVNNEGDIIDTITTETVLEDTNEAPIYSKTPVYERVVDISEHQDPNKIDYNKFAADIDGAILRTSIMDANTKNIRTDYAVERHYKELNNRGVPLGFYHYSRAISPDEGIREANYVLSVIADKNVSLPVYIDIEDDKRQGKASAGQVSSAAEAFVQTMLKNGYTAGIYSYPWFANKYLTHDVRNKYEFWIADYKSQGFTKYKSTDFDSWQYSHTGRVRGYGGNIDMNVLYKDYPLIMTGKSRKSINKLVDEIIAGKRGTGLERQRRLTYAGYNYSIVQREVNKRLKNA